MKRIAIHPHPDADMLVAAWLLARFRFAGERVGAQFLDVDAKPMGGPCDAMVGVGSAYCTQTAQFDHTPFNIAGCSSSRAARLVWEDLLARGFPVASLAPVIDSMDEGDRLRMRSRDGNAVDVHARVSQGRRRTSRDQDLWRLVSRWLDRRCRTNRRQTLTDPQALPSRYGRGKVYLRTLATRQSERRPPPRLRWYPEPLPALSQWDRGWAVARNLAEAWGVPDDGSVPNDAKLAHALDTLAIHVDPEMRQEVLTGTLVIPERTLLWVSGRGTERQRFEIARARAGQAIDRNQSPRVYDTPGFFKVISRLSRACGIIRMYAERLPDAAFAARRAHVREQVGQLEDSARRLAAVLETMPIAAGAEAAAHTSYANQGAASQSADELLANQKVPSLRTSLGWVEKNIRDVPRMPSQINPSLEEKTRARDLAWQILVQCEKMRQRLGP